MVSCWCGLILPIRFYIGVVIWFCLCAPILLIVICFAGVDLFGWFALALLMCLCVACFSASLLPFGFVGLFLICWFDVVSPVLFRFCWFGLTLFVSIVFAAFPRFLWRDLLSFVCLRCLGFSWLC